ncbi:MAG: hypothetical protein V1772_08365, partial [Chloroflexota bacterium]
PTYTGDPGYVARLGEQYATWDVDMIPNSYGSLAQVIQLPQEACDPGLLLAFRYRINTYDLAWGKPITSSVQETWLDPFRVHIRDVNGGELTSFLPEGNLMSWEGFYEYQKLYDSGWRREVIDLTPWAGQRIWIDFRQWNLIDKNWPSWTFVDDVQLVSRSGRVVSLPLISRQPGLLRAEPPVESGPAPMADQPSAPIRPSERPPRG